MNRTTTILAAGAFSLSALMATAAGAQSLPPTMEELGLDNPNTADQCIYEEFVALKGRLDFGVDWALDELETSNFPDTHSLALELMPDIATHSDIQVPEVRAEFERHADGLTVTGAQYHYNAFDTGIVDLCESETGATANYDPLGIGYYNQFVVRIVIGFELD